jgi:penicillin-binding protein 1A
MSGGWSFEASQFNRATQAQRQPGSAFKPFVYLAALEQGLTPASIVLDAPITVDQGEKGVWKPGNYSRHFYGATPMRVGVEQSRNLMTIRIASAIGLEHVVATARDFGITDRLPPYMSGALGVAETTPLKLTAAYGMLVNGGMRIQPTLIDRVQDRNGRTIYRADRRECPGCADAAWEGQPVSAIADERARVVDEASAFQMVSILQGAVERGTGRRILGLGKPLAGKTGTTNDSNDTWFIGFSPDLVVGVWFGFDTPRTLGPNETGASVAVPVFRDVMEAALRDQAPIPFRVPPGIRLVRVDPATGLPVRPSERGAIWEAF